MALPSGRRLAESAAGSDRQTTRTGRVFGSSDLEKIAALGRDEQWWIDPGDLTMPTPSCILGMGGFGVVATASYRGQSVAVKVCPGSCHMACLPARHARELGGPPLGDRAGRDGAPSPEAPP